MKLSVRDRLLVLLKGELPFPRQSSRLVDFLPSAKTRDIDQAGDLWLNSIVAACLFWAGRTVPSVKVSVALSAADGTEKTDPNHRLTRLLSRPNPYISQSNLLRATILSLMVDGNAYWIVLRNAADLPAQLWWVPHWMMEAYWSGGSFIDGYVYTVDGKRVQLPTEDVIHFRWGVDPVRPRYGLAPLQSALREIVTDNEAATYSKAILRNMGVLGGILAPKGEDVEPSDAEKLKAAFAQNYTGENRGRILVPSFAVDFISLTANPSDLSIDALRDVPEERICALFGIPAAVVGLGTGMQQTKVGATMVELRREAYESFVIPMGGLLADDLTRQLLPNYGGDEGDRVVFDYSSASIFQPDRNALATQLNTGVSGGWLRIADARRAFDPSLPVDENDEVYLWDASKIPVERPSDYLPEETETETE